MTDCDTIMKNEKEQETSTADTDNLLRLTDLKYVDICRLFLENRFRKIKALSPPTL